MTEQGYKGVGPVPIPARQIRMSSDTITVETEDGSHEFPKKDKRVYWRDGETYFAVIGGKLFRFDENQTIIGVTQRPNPKETK